MSQLGKYIGLDYIKTITGDSGGAVGPDSVQNLNLVGDGSLITVVGDQATNTLTITGDESIAAQFDTDAGTAIPVGNILNILGGTGMSTSGSSNTVTVTLSVPVTVSNGGTGATSLTQYGVLVGSGTAAVTITSPGTNGQVFLGATGADPAFGTLTSADNSVVYATGANSLDLTVDIAAAGGVDGLIPDSGTSPVVPDASGDITLAGGTNINTVGGTNTFTVNLDDNITVTSMATDNTTTGITITNNSISCDGTDSNIELLIDGKGTSGVTATTGLTLGDSSDLTWTINGAAVTAKLSVDTAGASDLLGTVEHRHSDTAAYGGHQMLLRSRGTHASPTIVQDDDLLGQIAFAGYDGTDYALAARIQCYVDNTPGANDMPARLEFYTSADGSQTPTLGLRIDSDQTVTVPDTLTVTTAANLSYMTQYYLPIVGASGAIQNLADGLGTSGQVLTSNGAGAEPTWETPSAGGGGITWNVATGSTQAMAVNNGYFANYNGTLAFTLPATAAVGDTMEIAQMFAGQGWSLAQNSGQTCYIGNTNTTITTGTLASTDDGDWIEIVCRVANTDFQVNVKSGNITVT